MFNVCLKFLKLWCWSLCCFVPGTRKVLCSGCNWCLKNGRQCSVAWTSTVNIWIRDKMVAVKTRGVERISWTGSHQMEKIIRYAIIYMPFWPNLLTDLGNILNYLLIPVNLCISYSKELTQRFLWINTERNKLLTIKFEVIIPVAMKSIIF
jgi:hypothetical protein